MDHSYIEDNQIAERYVLGKLSAAEASLFEEHSLGCADCLDALELTERLHRGLSQLAARELARTAAVARLGVLARLAALSRSRQASLFVTLALFLVVLPTTLLLVRIDHLDRRLAVARSAPAIAAVPAGAENPENRKQVEALGAQLGAVRGELAEEKGRGARALAAEEKKREELTRELSRAQRPQVNTPIVPLSAERSGSSSGAPTSRVVLAPDSDWVVLSLDVEGQEAPRYRVTLVGPQGGELWKSSDLKAAGGSLALSLPRALLPAGDYRLRVEGLPGQGAPFPAGRFAFRVAHGG